MSEREEYILFAFKSPHGAIKSEVLLKELSPKIVPTLREISTSCGMSVKLKTEHRDRALGIIEAEGLRRWGLYSIKAEGKNISADLIKSQD